MYLKIVPRLENISWSLYWKEAMTVDTTCLECVDLPLTCRDLDAMNGQGLLEQVAGKMGWQATATLHRLENFNEPWERLIFKGREITGEQSLKAAGVQDGDEVVVVRRTLCADGWKVALADDFLSDEEEA